MTRQTDNGFQDLNIIPSLLKGINWLKFKNPTPIQRESIPVGIRGDDIIAMAQTGSGKTLAFGIPMVQRLSQKKRGAGLVLVPTRELALQVDESLQAMSRTVHVRSTVVIGGASMSVQRSALAKNPRIIIATPGRLMDHLEKGTVDLSKINMLVLDEADRMLDMGFLPDIKKIMKSIPASRQTMLFSATMPKEIEAIAENMMRDPVRIKVDRSGATPTEVSQEMFFIKNQDKSRLLAVQLQKCSGPVLVFTRTKWTAKKLTGTVNNMGFSAAQIHSNRTLGQRRMALEGFKRGQFKVLIATDIAARGIDVSGIELVVNYDMPGCSEDYVHRIGRTGRAGKTGHAVSFATSDQKGSIKDLERFMKTKLAISALPILPPKTLPGDGSARPSTRNEISRDRAPFKKRTSQKSRPAKPRVSKPKGPEPVEIDQSETKLKRHFSSYFKKNQPAKKKPAGKSARRKSRSKKK